MVVDQRVVTSHQSYSPLAKFVLEEIDGAAAMPWVFCWGINGERHHDTCFALVTRLLIIQLTTGIINKRDGNKPIIPVVL